MNGYWWSALTILNGTSGEVSYIYPILVTMRLEADILVYLARIHCKPSSSYAPSQLIYQLKQFDTFNIMTLFVGDYENWITVAEMMPDV